MNPKVGAKIGRFQLMRRLDSDDDRVLWLGSHDAFGNMEIAAIDLPPGDAPDPVRATNLRREAEIAQHLRHDGVQRVLEIGDSNGQTWIAREHVEGVTLARLRPHLESLRPSDDSRRLSCIAHIIGSILDILAHAHSIKSLPGMSFGLTHGQLTVNEILVSTRGVIKIAGFGIDRRASDGTAGMLTHDGLRSFAPELLSGAPLAPTSDLYATGILLHDLLDGRPAWADLDGVSLYQAILGNKPLPFQHPPPSELAALHDALTAASLSQRVPDASAALQLLRRWKSDRPDPAADVGSLVREVLNPTPAPDLFDQLSRTSSELGPATPPASPMSPPPASPAGGSSTARPVMPSVHTGSSYALEPNATGSVAPSSHPLATPPGASFPRPVAAASVGPSSAEAEDGTLMIDPDTLARMRAAASQSSAPPRGAVAPPALMATPAAHVAPPYVTAHGSGGNAQKPAASALPGLLPGLIRNSPAQPPAGPSGATPRPHSAAAGAPGSPGVAPSPPPSRPYPAPVVRRTPFEIPPAAGDGTTTAMLVRRERRGLAITVVAGTLVAVTLGAAIAYLIIS